VAITVANRNSVLNALLRASAYTGAAALYLSIHTADPGDTGASEYTTYTGTRPAISFGAAASGAATSTNEQDFAAMGATTITYVGLWSATTGGAFQGGGPLNVSRITLSGDTLRAVVGAITVTVT